MPLLHCPDRADRIARIRSRGSDGADQIARTFSACGPFWPWVTSNSTRCASSSERYPDPLIAEKWQKTSAPPPSCSMKPKPFSALNHYTVP